MSLKIFDGSKDVKTKDEIILAKRFEADRLETLACEYLEKNPEKEEFILRQGSCEGTISFTTYKDLKHDPYYDELMDKVDDLREEARKLEND